MKHTLFELREITVALMVISSYNRAVVYQSVTQMIRTGQEIEGLINHLISDKLTAKREELATLSELIVEPFREQLSENMENEEHISKMYKAALHADPDAQKLNQELNDLWNEEVEFKLPVIECPAEDYNLRFPDEEKTVSLFGMNFTRSGLDCFQKLDLRGVIKIV